MLRIKFNFDLILELLREEDEHKKLGRPYGLKFERFDKVLILKSGNEKALIAWRDRLAGKLNLRGFH